MTVAQDKTGVGAGSMEWQTPPELFAWLNRRFQFDYDAFAGHENALCDLYSTVEGTYNKTLPTDDAEDSECLSCGARNVDLRSLPTLSTSSLIPERGMGSIAGAGIATAPMHESVSGDGEPTLWSGRGCSAKSDATRNQIEGEPGSGLHPLSTTTSAVTLYTHGRGSYGTPLLPTGEAVHTAASQAAPLNTITSSPSPMNPAQERCRGTSSPHASSALEASESDPSENGLPQKSSNECRHIWKTNGSDGLTNSWVGRRVWINPPYSRGLIDQCIEKAYNERNNAQIIVALIPASTETQWFQKFILPHCHIEWLPRRVRFIDPATGQPGQSPPSGSVVAIFKQGY